MGDTNHDGRNLGSDITLIATEIINEEKTFTVYEKIAGDMNTDGKLLGSDITILASKIISGIWEDIDFDLITQNFYDGLYGELEEEDAPEDEGGSEVIVPIPM